MDDPQSQNGTLSPFAIPVAGAGRRAPAEGQPLGPGALGTAEPRASGHRGPLLALISPSLSEREVRMRLEQLRARDLAASAYAVGQGLIVVPEPTPAAFELLGADPGVERLIHADTPYLLARRDVCPAGSRVAIGGAVFGGEAFGLIAGPCAVEGRAELLAVATAVAAGGAQVLRGGAFKPRTSPYAFQGLGEHGIDLLVEARALTGLPFVSEVVDPAQVEPLHARVDAYQVGARNMQNYELLKALGEVDRPVLLKRGPSATLEEWILAAEYVLAGGNPRVILCERGIRTFNRDTRFTLDLATMALAKRATHLPVIVDPSHATGRPELIAPMALAALAAGADGLIVEVHAHPEAALSDGSQALLPADFAAMVERLRGLAPQLGRRIEPGPARREP